MTEYFNGIPKVYQIELPLNHGETFELEVLDKDFYSILMKINDGAEFAMRLPKGLKKLKTGDKASAQYTEYASAGKEYAKIKILFIRRNNDG